MQLTIEGLLALIGAFVTVTGAGAAMWQALSKSIRDAEGKAAAVEKELAEYKTQVAKEYASMRHLKEVEERLVKAMDHLSDTISDMPQKIFDLFNAAPKNGNGRGRSL